MHAAAEDFLGCELSLGKLFFRQPKLDHHPLLAFVVDQEMAMEENVAVFLKVCARDGLAPRTVGIEGRGPQDDVLAVERAVALANRHRRLARVVPYRGEAIRFVIEAGDSCAGALRSVNTNEDEVGLQKLAVLDHVLLTRALGHDGLPIRRKERLDEVPVARKLREQLLTGPRPVRRLVLIVALLRDRRRSYEQRCKHPLHHSANYINRRLESTLS
jgi:hypothetical protein